MSRPSYNIGIDEDEHLGLPEPAVMVGAPSVFAHEVDRSEQESFIS